MNKPEKKALELLKKFKIETPPVPVDDIAKKLGANVLFEPFKGKDDISGILYRDNEQIIIGINSDHLYTRQRFSIAHEIGHLVLHNKELFVDKVVKVNFRDHTSSLAVDREEISANTFAAELLMPRDFIKNEILKIIETKIELTIINLVEKLSRIFNVSEEAIKYRLINLGIITNQ